ncbi:uncharacterized protein LOC143469133 isoform X2 [Clavelina lepadiformis]|uniref:uncharacterized protein LOC143469133 isoform X2 n=1 Tax=Clavelina lepadiformis TaxID=159417 RepID=UPI004041AD1E
MSLTISWKSLMLFILLAKSFSDAKSFNIPYETGASDFGFFEPSEIDNENASNENTPLNTIYGMDNRASKPAEEEMYQNIFPEELENHLTKRNPEGELIKMIRFYLKQKKNRALAGNILKSMLQEYYK